MDVREVMDEAKDVLTADVVFGDRFEQDGLIVLPAATIRGGGGGGSGEAPNGEGKGTGGGIGVSGRPIGAFVIKGDEVSWKPAFDRNRAIGLGTIVAVVGLWAATRIVRIVMEQRRARRTAEVLAGPGILSHRDQVSRGSAWPRRRSSVTERSAEDWRL